MRGIAFLQTTAMRNGLASPIVVMRYSIMLILFLVLTGIPRQTNAAPTYAPKPASGRLTVWVPSGVVGDNYWIYVDGHVVSAPPHNPADPGAGNFTAVKTKKGWEIWNQHGLILRMIHDYGWDRDFSPYTLDAESRETLHLFQPVELSLSAGKHEIDIAILLPGPFYKSSFPFVVSAGWKVDVGPAKPTQLYLSIPDVWEDGSSVPPALPAESHRACPGGVPSPPNGDQVKQKIRAYRDDPIASALRAANARLSHPKGVVLIDLPLEQGGPREFDGTQISSIVAAISDHNDFPSQSDIQDCQRLYPQFSKSYATYGDLIRFVDNELDSFRKLAASLKQGQ
ncbi:MAG: hypothetical protein ACRD4F_17880 [Candidatus Angelobacter sp.]